jgi:hypothetical protein
MGHVIRSDAASADIFADVGDSYTKAIARKGTWQQLADVHLAPTVKLVADVTVKLADAQKTASPLVLVLEVTREQASKAVGKAYDDCWNAVGRPAVDPTLDVIFPGGFSFYVDGSVGEQPERMDLLVGLLGMSLHPNLPANVAGDSATAVGAAATGLRQALTDAQSPKNEVLLLERVTQALARSAALKLAGFKRALKAAGFSEAEIHTVIPNHPKPKPAKPNGAATATPPAVPPPAPPATPPAPPGP